MSHVLRGPRLLLALAAVAVAFAAADNYVVVLALPDMMASSDVSADELQRGAPIISGFLLGYIAVLPLIGRIADLRGRLPVLVGSLVIFALGSLITAASYDLTSIVVGRLLQGVGAGGLLPATLALVADLYPPHRRGVPLGVVGAVQEFGNVMGPVYGALVLAVGDWRLIFWVNLAVALVLVVVIAATRERRTARRRVDRVGVGLLGLSLAAALVVMLEPRGLTDDVTWGLGFLPVVGESRWLSPLGLVAVVAALLLALRGVAAADPLLHLRAWARLLREVDLLGTTLLALALAGIILAFSTADAKEQALAPGWPWLLACSALASAGFAWRNGRTEHPLVPRRAVAATGAWGALLVSFFVGAALIAALVDIPIFARLTVYPDSQLAAALVLVRFLIGLPIGAFLGGWLTHHWPAGVVTALGMAAAAAAFLEMTTWGLETLRDPVSNVWLVLAGTGVGLAMAPVNAALLASTAREVHGVASALLVVGRTVGKLVGISVLTTIGLRRYYSEQADLPAPREVCLDGSSRCPEFTLVLREAGLTQLHTIFFGAAVCCVVAGLVALVVFRHVETRGVRTRVLETGLG